MILSVARITELAGVVAGSHKSITCLKNKDLLSDDRMIGLDVEILGRLDADDTAMKVNRRPGRRKNSLGPRDFSLVNIPL